jgi:hypothetical protein
VAELARRHQLVAGRPARVALLQWVSSLGAVTPEALAVWRGIGVRAAANQLRAAERAGLLACHRVLVGRPSLYTPTRLGRQVATQPDLPTCKVTAANAQHLIVCATTAAVLQRRYPGLRVQGELQLRRDERLAGHLLASSQLRGAAGRVTAHRPDLVLWPPREDGRGPVVVEVELSLKSSQRLRAICAAWAQCECVVGVVYLAAPVVEAALERAIATSSAHARVSVLALDRVVGKVPPIAGEVSSKRTIPSGS